MTKIQWRTRGFRELRTDPRVTADLRARARRVADAAGDGFEVGDEQEPRTRAHATVYASTFPAKKRANDLLRALTAGAD